jgi:hypothetical protein
MVLVETAKPTAAATPTPPPPPTARLAPPPSAVIVVPSVAEMLTPALFAVTPWVPLLFLT